MKKFFLLIGIPVLCLTNICSAQVYKYVYYFDSRLGIADASNAVIIGKGLNEDQLFRLDYFERLSDHLLITAHYFDSSIAILEGEFTQFYEDGSVDNQGSYLHDQKDGLWQKWNSLHQKTDSTIYSHNKILTAATFDYHSNGRISSYSFTDSLTDTYTSTTYDEKGTVGSDVFFTGQSGIIKRYDSRTVAMDSLFTREQAQASFPGGQNAWIKYLQKNLNANKPVDNGASAGIYQVIVKFMVAIDGSISNVTSETSHGYGMEQEVIRIIKNGPRWEAAIQYGHKVNAYRRQPITFIVDQDR